MPRELVIIAPVWESFPKAPELTEEQLEGKRIAAGENDAVDRLAREATMKVAWRNKDKDGEIYTYVFTLILL